MRTHWTPKALIALPLEPGALARRSPTTSRSRKEELAGKLNGIEANDISDSPVQGLYQVAVGANVAYVTSRRQIHLPRRHLRRRLEREHHRGDALARPRRDAARASIRRA